MNTVDSDKITIQLTDPINLRIRRPRSHGIWRHGNYDSVECLVCRGNSEVDAEHIVGIQVVRTREGVMIRPVQYWA